MLKLQIFGYSLTNSFYKPENHDNQGRGPKTFVDLLHDRFNTTSDPSLRGIPMCSEERILYNLKKTKDIDVAIIIHSQPIFWFFFLDNRDLRVMNEKDLTNFFEVTAKNRGDETYGYFYKTNSVEDSTMFTIEQVEKLVQFQQDYMLTPDLIRNRYLGALIQIDQYCTAKKIPVIHCVNPKEIPNWFKFSSGIVDTDLKKLAAEHFAGYNISVNSISDDGNRIIADKLEEYILSLIDIQH
jgi:hypothetical protein